MVDIRHHPHRDRHVGRSDPLLEIEAGFDRLPEFTPNRHGLPEDITEASRLRVLRYLAPAVDGDADQRLAASKVVEIAVGENRKLRADRLTTEIGYDASEGLEPVDIVTPDLCLRVSEVIEPTIGPVMPELMRTRHRQVND